MTKEKPFSATFKLEKETKNTVLARINAKLPFSVAFWQTAPANRSMKHPAQRHSIHDAVLRSPVFTLFECMV